MRTEYFVRDMRRLILLMLFACEVTQFFQDESLVNNTCAFIAAISSAVTMLYVFNVKRFRQGPLSCLMILGYNISALSGALIIQTAYLRSVTYNLDVPIQSFISLMFAQFLIIVLHYLYQHSRTLRNLRFWLTARVFAPIGLMEAPSNMELWIFGLVGCGATMISAHSYTDAIQFGDVSSKFALGFVPFSVAPFFIPMRAFLLGNDSPRSSWLPLTLYTLFLIAVAMANNARGTFSSGFLTLALCGLVTVLSGNFSLTPRRIARGVVMIGIAVPIFTALSDLATAMVIARDERSNLSPFELIEITLNNYQDKPLIDERRHRDAVVSGSEYNENYISNPIFARFVYTKFVDVNMNNALQLSDSQVEEIRKQTGSRLLSMLPAPVINFFHLDLDKADLGYSSGDLYSYIVRGLQLGSYTTGSEIPDGLTIFGSLFWPVLALLVLTQFMIYDGFSDIGKDGRLRVSAVVLLNVVPIFTVGVMQESVSNQIVAIIRGVPQLIFLYWILRLMTSALLRPLTAMRRMVSSVAVTR